MNNRDRNMVGGYSDMNSKLLKDDKEIMEIANFALRAYISSDSLPYSSAAAITTTNAVSGSSSFVVTPEELEGGIVHIKVLEAQKQVSRAIIEKLKENEI